MRLNRRRFVGLSSSGLLAAAHGAVPFQRGAGAVAAQEAKPGGTLRWGHTSDGYIGLHFPWTLAGGINHTPLVKMSQEGPFFRNHEMALEPNLAESYEYDADYRAFTVTIKQGITWSDGTPLTARDVYGTMLLAHPDVTIKGAQGEMALIKGGRDYFRLGTTRDVPPGLILVDDYTLRIELEEPWSDAVWGILGGQQTLPWHIYQPLFEDPATRDRLGDYENPLFLEPQMQIGTGPFIFEEGDKDRYLRYVKNPTYHGTAPLLDAVEFIRFGSADATIIALERGEIDATVIGDAQFLRSVQEMEDVALYESLDYYLRFLRYNWNRPYLNDPRVYQAIDMAIDRAALCDQVLGGACVAWRQYGYGTDGFNQNPYNPDRAKELLAEANWDSGIELELITDYNDDLTQELLPAIVAMLGQAGIKAHSRVYQGAALQEVVDSGEIDLWYDGTWATSTFTPGQFDDPIFTDAQGNQYPEPGDGRKQMAGNAFGFHPDWIHTLYAEHRSASPERREEIRNEVEVRLADEGSSWMILGRYKRFLAARKVFHGLEDPNTMLWVSDVFVNKSMAWSWWTEE